MCTMDSQIRNYVENLVKKGISKEGIVNLLLKKGYSRETILDNIGILSKKRTIGKGSKYINIAFLLLTLILFFYFVKYFNFFACPWCY